MPTTWTRCRSFLLALWITACSDPTPPPPDVPEPATAVILTYGHGSFIGPQGENLAPSLALFERTQQAYLDRLRAAGGELEVTESLIAAQVGDPFLANALVIEQLIAAVRPDTHATMETVNGAMRAYYLDKLAPSQLPSAERHRTKGVGAEVAARLEANGVATLVTYNGGQKYIDECRANGVPIPPPMYGKGWTNDETFDPEEFISGDLVPELWHHRSEEPGSEGLCVALPRHAPGSDDVQLFGLICLGTTSNKACFWDNPRGTFFQRNVERPIEDFVSGFDLKANNQGVCSDCHAGENPYIIHPEKEAFGRLIDSGPRFGTDWYEPIVHPDWPQNPGPTPILETLTTDGRCDSCHQAGSAGRFPAVSTELAGYCSMVLRTAVFGKFTGTETAPITMPPSYAPMGNYGDDIDLLIRQCSLPSATGKVVGFTPPAEASWLSPPLVIGPLYGCATQVAVRGAVLDAKVTLHVNTLTYELIGRNPAQVTFDVAPLVAGDVVWAEQERLGSTSTTGMAAAVTVRDHRVDYPMGLPAPRVDPDLIYQCSSVIAVAHVPGSTVTVYAEGTEVTGSGATGWTAFGPGNAPFEIGDAFTARQSLCGDPLSPPSDPAFAVAAPTSFGAPTFEPAATFDGQELVSLSSLTNGALTKLSVGGASGGGFRTPISWFPNYDLATALGRPLALGDAVSAGQELCTMGPIATLPPTTKCEDLPAPRIFQPIPGTRFVVVRSSIPGARIHVYDRARIELGDGGGTIIRLNRDLVVGDVIDVVQSVRTCTSRSSHRLTVVTGGKN